MMATLFGCTRFWSTFPPFIYYFSLSENNDQPASCVLTDPIACGLSKVCHPQLLAEPTLLGAVSFVSRVIASGVLLNLATRDGGYLSWCVQTISPPQPSTWTTLRGDQRGASSSIIPVASLCPRARHCVLTPVLTPLSQLTVARL